jgi:signal transduction histidine kinase
MREPAPDVPTLLERLGGAVGADAVMTVRRVGSSIGADAAWLAGERWWSRSARLSDLDGDAFDGSDPSVVLSRAAAALRIRGRFEWLVGRAGGTHLVLGLAGTALSSPTVARLASGVDVLIARDVAMANARLNALLLERARIASDIHHGVCQEVGTLRLQLQVLGELLDRDPERARDLLAEVERSAAISAENLRSAVVHLAPVPADNTWLTGGLREYLTDIAAASDMKIDYEVRGRVQTLDPEPLALVFAFVQEGVTNAKKHAGRDTVTVRVEFDERSVCVDVMSGDSELPNADGDLDAPAGHGLSLMRGRARLLGGDVRFARSSSGSRLTMEVPV